eukprot:5955504-Pleurochrysis_carterae.AAC.1
MARHGAAEAQAGGGAAGAQPSPAGGRNWPPAGEGVRRHPRPDLGLFPVDEAYGSERGLRMGASA